MEMMPMNPFAMMGGQQAQMQGSNFNPADKIAKEVTKTLSAVISQQAAEGYQHLTSMGVPMATAGKHVLDQLMALTGQQKGQQDALMAPPGQNQQLSQQQKPPQPPNPGPLAKNQDTAQAPSQDASGDTPQAPAAGQTPGVAGGNPQDLNQIPTAQQIAGRFIQPQTNNMLPFQNTIDANGSLHINSPIGSWFGGINTQQYQQAMSGNAMNPANTTEEKAVGAAITPPTQAEQKSLQAGGFTAQQTNLKDQSDALDKNIENIQKQMTEVVAHPYQSYAAGINLGDLHKQLVDFTNKRLEVQQKLENLRPNSPNFQSSNGNLITHTPEQIKLYNSARAKGKSIAEAKKVARF